MRKSAPRLRRPLAVAALLCAGVLAGCGGRGELESLTPRVGEIQESFTEPARTRLATTHLISMPVGARIERILLEPGDRVEAGQPLVRVDLVPFELDVQETTAAVEELQAQIAVKENDELEETARIEVKATIEASEEALNASRAQVEAESKRKERNNLELARLEQAFKAGAVTATALDDARLAADTSEIEYLRQLFYEKALNALMVAIKLGPRFIDNWLSRKRLEKGVLTHQLLQAQVQLAGAEHQRDLARSLVAPVAGVVLERYEQGDATLPPGTHLLLLGDLEEMEASADVLTQDALRLETGSEVVLDPGGGQAPIAGRVKRIEPAAFTKLSSLGVEQQRVRVIVGLDSRPEGLGVGYRLQARFITGTRAQALVVPRFSVLQDVDQSYYVFKISNGRLQRQTVELGLRSDLELEVTGGLAPTDRIVKTPDSTLHDGDRVR